MTIIGIAPVLGITTLANDDTHRLTVAATGQPVCPSWCVGDCAVDSDALALTARLHERTITALTVSDVEDGKAMDVRLHIERCDDPEDSWTQTRVVLTVERPDVPSPVEVDVAGHTGRYSDNQCRYMLASYLAGVYERNLVAMTPAELRELARAATVAVDLQAAADAAEGR